MPSPAVTSRQPGAKFFCESPRCSCCDLSRCVILATRTVATGRFGKVIRASHQILSSIAATSWLHPYLAADLLQVGAIRGSDQALSRRWLTGCQCPQSSLPVARRSRWTRLPARPARSLAGWPVAGVLGCFCTTGRSPLVIPELRLDNLLRELLAAEYPSVPTLCRRTDTGQPMAAFESGRKTGTCRALDSMTNRDMPYPSGQRATRR